MKKLISITITILLIISFISTSFAKSYEMHTVTSGDTYWKLSNTYNLNLNSLLSINNAINPALKVGDFIKIAHLPKDIEISVNGILVVPDSSPYLENDRTFVPIRFIAEALNADVSWDSASSSAIIKNNDKTIKLPVGSQTISVDGVSEKVDAPIKLYDGRVFIPLRFISELLNCSVTWNQSSYTVDIYTNQAQSVTNNDLYWLSRIVSAEAAGEPYEGQLAVANVVINRKNSPDFPNTIKEVIFDKNYGYQFTPVLTGTIYNSPTNSSIKAAQEALDGNDNIGNALFFVNLQKTTLTWIQTSRTFFKKIGNHEFYL